MLICGMYNLDVGGHMVGKIFYWKMHHKDVEMKPAFAIDNSKLEWPNSLLSLHGELLHIERTYF